MDAFIGCSLTPALIWANFEHFRQFFDRDMPFSVNPFSTDWLKTLIVPHLVTLHWPTTPYNARMRILAAEVVHDWPGLFLSHLVIKFYITIPTPGCRAIETFQFCPFWLLTWCLHRYMSNQHFESQQSDTGQRLCTHTHEAYSSTTWLFCDKNQ